jgi:hypothetical protein
MQSRLFTTTTKQSELWWAQNFKKRLQWSKHFLQKPPAIANAKSVPITAKTLWAPVAVLAHLLD